MRTRMPQIPGAFTRPLELPADALEPDPSYRSVLDWVWSFSAGPRTPDVIAGQRRHKLERMRHLLASVGDPQTRFASLLVAGTKGKGSIVAMLASCLYAAGYATGRYTSPHLVNWRERVWLDGAPIAAEAVVALAPAVRAAVAALPGTLGMPTTFEVGTLFAFLHFARRRVRVAVVEVGVGGRLDATNVVEPLVSIIAPISYDHTGTLGTTLSEIARHKAGILRAGRPAVVSPQPPEALRVIEEEAARLASPLLLVGRDWRWHSGDGDGGRFDVAGPERLVRDVRVPLLGAHQRDNATAAVAALAALGEARVGLAVPVEAVLSGLAGVSWPGRLEVLRTEPTVVVDGAQNAGSAEVLRQALSENFSFERLWLVLGVTAGKDVAGILRVLAPLAARVIATQSRHERAVPPADLVAALHEVAPSLPSEMQPDMASALAAALRRAGPRDLVLVTGSLFLVGEALTLGAAA